MTKEEILNIFKVDLKNEGDYEKYDDDLNSVIDGIHQKDFIRADKNHFEEVFKKRKNKKSDSYITYIDNIRKEGIAPEKLSTLKKYMLGPLTATKETIASKLLNYFDCPTAYNSAVEKNLSNNRGFMVYSLDFISENESFENILRLINLDEDRIYTIWPVLEDYLKKRFFGKSETFNEDLLKLKKDFIKSHFIREFIIGDRDIGTHNFGLLTNEKTNRFRFISFDFESTFCEQRYKNDHFNMEYMFRKQPELVKEIYDKCMELKSVLNANKDSFSEDKEIEESIQRCIRNLLINIDSFIERYNKHLQTSVK